MLFFFDQNFAYVLAEATRTLSLQDDSVRKSSNDVAEGNTPVNHEQMSFRIPCGLDTPKSHAAMQ